MAISKESLIRAVIYLNGKVKTRGVEICDVAILCEIYRKLIINLLEYKGKEERNLCYGCITKYLGKFQLVEEELLEEIDDLIIFRNSMLHSIFNFYKYQEDINNFQRSFINCGNTLEGLLKNELICDDFTDYVKSNILFEAILRKHRSSNNGQEILKKANVFK